MKRVLIEGRKLMRALHSEQPEFRQQFSLIEARQSRWSNLSYSRWSVPVLPIGKGLLLEMGWDDHPQGIEALKNRIKEYNHVLDRLYDVAPNGDCLKRHRSAIRALYLLLAILKSDPSEEFMTEAQKGIRLLINEAIPRDQREEEALGRAIDHFINDIT